MQIHDKMKVLISEMLDGRILLNEAISEFERIYIEKALELNNDHLSKTACVLGIHRNTLSKRLTGYNDHSKTTMRPIKRKAR